MRLKSLVMLTILAAGSGCAGRMGLGGSGDDALVYFANESTEQAALYAVSSAEEVRIGTVTAGQTDTLRVPDDMVARGQIRFVARLLARSETPSSGVINVRRGDRLSVRLPPSRNTLTVLPGP